MQLIRNIAIIAHVDHGKTTLVDRIIQECQVLDQRKEAGDLILDSNDLERERGITILSKNVSANYKGVKINIIDTPGMLILEVKLKGFLKWLMVFCCLLMLLKDQCLRQDLFWEKQLALGLKPIVVVNKVDKDNCRPDEVQQDIYELMFNLDASDDQLEF